MELPDLALVRILREIQRHSHRQHAVGLDAGIDPLQLHEAAQHQSGADEQHERHRNLGDDQRAPEADPASPVLRPPS